MQRCKNHSPGKALACRLSWPGVGGGEAACASGSRRFLCIGYWVHCIVHPPLLDGTLRQLSYILFSSILNEKLRGWSCPRRQSVPGTGLEGKVDTASEKKPESFIWLRIRILGPGLARGLSFPSHEAAYPVAPQQSWLKGSLCAVWKPLSAFLDPTLNGTCVSLKEPRGTRYHCPPTWNPLTSPPKITTHTQTRTCKSPKLLGLFFLLCLAVVMMAYVW